MSLSTDEILPEDPTGEIVHWMEPSSGRSQGGEVSKAATGAFLLGVAAALGGMALVRYIGPRREGLPPWRWNRGPLH